MVPLGATEQHGPIGLLGTDSITAEAVAMKLCLATNTLLFPTLSVGMSMHHCAFPGSVSLRPSTYARVISDIIESLTMSSNFTHIYFLNGHGGNIMPFKFANESFSLKANSSSAKEASVYKEGTEYKESKVKLGFFSWFMGKKVSSLAKEFFNNSIGQHATPDEISMTQYLYQTPAAVRPTVDVNIQKPANFTARLVDKMIDEKEDELWLEELAEDERNRYRMIRGAALNYMDPSDFKRRFPDGRSSVDLVESS